MTEKDQEPKRLRWGKEILGEIGGERTIFVGPMRPDGSTLDEVVFTLKHDIGFTDTANRQHADFIIDAVNSKIACDEMTATIEADPSILLDGGGDFEAKLAQHIIRQRDRRDAAIPLRVPMSGDEEIDDMIREARRWDMATAVAVGLAESGDYSTAADFNHDATMYADALIAALETKESE